MEASVKKTKNVIVDYPGVVVSVDKMLETLGGESNVTKVYKDPVLRLGMKMRPDDVFCKPLCADRHNTRSLILKVNPPSSPAEGDASGELDAEVVGIAETEFRFESLADFQYLAMTKKDENSPFESIYHKIVPPRTERITEQFVENKSVPLFLPSPIYSRVDHESEYSYKDRPESRQEKAAQPEGVITLDRKKRHYFSKFHSFKAGDVPSEPYPQALERYNSKPRPTDLDYVIKLKELFEKRPLWTKIAIASITKYGKEVLKQTLPLVAYYWDTGPWRTMWCVYGYDPRKDPTAKKYQLVDFRLKGLVFKEVSIKRSSCRHYNLPSQQMRAGSGIPAPTIRHHDLLDPKSVTTEKPDNLEKYWKFRPNVLPSQRQFFYQMLDIEMDEVQELVHANDGKETECTEREGWCQENVVETIRKKMVNAVIQFMEAEKMKDPSSTKSSLPQSSWEAAKPYHVMQSKKGKSGPKHQPKRSKVQSGQNESETSLSERLSTMDVESDAEELSSDATSEDSDYSDEINTSQRDLRTRKVVKDFGDVLSEGSDEREQYYDYSDDDPEFDPSMA